VRSRACAICIRPGSGLDLGRLIAAAVASFPATALPPPPPPLPALALNVATTRSSAPDADLLTAGGGGGKQLGRAMREKSAACDATAEPSVPRRSVRVAGRNNDSFLYRCPPVSLFPHPPPHSRVASPWSRLLPPPSPHRSACTYHREFCSADPPPSCVLLDSVVCGFQNAFVLFSSLLVLPLLPPPFTLLCFSLVGAAAGWALRGGGYVRQVGLGRNTAGLPE